MGNSIAFSFMPTKHLTIQEWRQGRFKICESWPQGCYSPKLSKSKLIMQPHSRSVLRPIPHFNDPFLRRALLELLELTHLCSQLGWNAHVHSKISASHGGSWHCWCIKRKSRRFNGVTFRHQWLNFHHLWFLIRQCMFDEFKDLLQSVWIESILKFFCNHQSVATSDT